MPRWNIHHLASIPSFQEAGRAREVGLLGSRNISQFDARLYFVRSFYSLLKEPQCSTQLGTYLSPNPQPPQLGYFNLLCATSLIVSQADIRLRKSNTEFLLNGHWRALYLFRAFFLVVVQVSVRHSRACRRLLCFKKL